MSAPRYNSFAKASVVWIGGSPFEASPCFHFFSMFE